MVQVRSSRGRPWKPWSDPGEKAVRESEIKEREKRREDERGGRRLKKERK
jgi:hypothetical protein